jgi:5-methylcytosine-specific restriction endonuclease McrA
MGCTSYDALDLDSYRRLTMKTLDFFVKNVNVPENYIEDEVAISNYCAHQREFYDTYGTYMITTVFDIIQDSLGRAILMKPQHQHQFRAICRLLLNVRADDILNYKIILSSNTSNFALDLESDVAPRIIEVQPPICTRVQPEIQCPKCSVRERSDRASNTIENVATQVGVQERVARSRSDRAALEAAQPGVDIRDRFELWMYRTYWPFCRDSANPKRPNMNVQNVMAQYNSGQISKYIKTSEELIAYFQYVNDTHWRPLCRDVHIQSCRRGSVSLYIHADKYGRWASDTNWYKAFLINSGVTCASIPELPVYAVPPLKPKRTAIKKDKRNVIWEMHFPGADVGICSQCHRQMFKYAFDASHIISFANGGSEDISNLIPLCPECNRKMGKTNMEIVDSGIRSRLGR